MTEKFCSSLERQDRKENYIKHRTLIEQMVYL